MYKIVSVYELDPLQNTSEMTSVFALKEGHMNLGIEPWYRHSDLNKAEEDMSV